MTITGERVILRPIRPSDFGKIVEWTTDDEVGHFMPGDGYPENVDECADWYQESLSNRHKQQFLIVLMDGTAIGDMELDHITWRSGDAELRIRIGEKQYRNKGYGTDAILHLLKHAFLSMKLSRIYLRVDRDNRRAIHVYEKIGFRKEGRLSRPSDSGPREIILMRVLADEFFRMHSNRLGNVS